MKPPTSPPRRKKKHICKQIWDVRKRSRSNCSGGKTQGYLSKNKNRKIETLLKRLLFIRKSCVESNVRTEKPETDRFFGGKQTFFGAYLHGILPDIRSYNLSSDSTLSDVKLESSQSEYILSDPTQIEKSVRLTEELVDPEFKRRK